MIFEPKILFLDEPTAGVDVNLRRDMWALVRALRDSGVTIILTTHYIDEAEEMADRIGVINQGQIILVENKVELMHKLGRKQLTVQLHQAIEYVPESLAFHRHHVTMKKFGSYRELYLLERNALLSMYKNLSDDLLSAALGPALVLALSRTAARSPLPDRGSGPTTEVPKLSLTGAYALDYLVEQLPTLVESRRHIQATRVRGDADLLPLFREPIEPAYPLPEYQAMKCSMP